MMNRSEATAVLFALRRVESQLEVYLFDDDPPLIGGEQYDPKRLARLLYFLSKDARELAGRLDSTWGTP